ncbi:MAG: flavodoxin [Methanosarcinaceae archaeon]|jgi:flavodoxin I|nr:flavodoxin [Methanosarcinaceae archaeon]
MSKAIIIYGTTTGNTEELTEYVTDGIKEGGLDVTVTEVTDAEINKLNDFDIIVLGCPTWNYGEIQDDFIEFYENMSKENFGGKKVAVFGPGDNDEHSETFCEAINLLEAKLKECGAEIIIESFKADGDVSPYADDAKKWGLAVTNKI